MLSVGASLDSKEKKSRKMITQCMKNLSKKCDSHIMFKHFMLYLEEKSCYGRKFKLLLGV